MTKKEENAKLKLVQNDFFHLILYFIFATATSVTAWVLGKINLLFTSDSKSQWVGEMESEKI